VPLQGSSQEQRLDQGSSHQEEPTTVIPIETRNDKCPVCLEDNVTITIFSTVCTHGVCADCRNQLRNFNCPVCRANIKPVLTREEVATITQRLREDSPPFDITFFLVGNPIPFVFGPNPSIPPVFGPNPSNHGPSIFGSNPSIPPVFGPNPSNHGPSIFGSNPSIPPVFCPNPSGPPVFGSNPSNHGPSIFGSNPSNHGSSISN